jgi:hypothetical protein
VVQEGQKRNLCEILAKNREKKKLAKNKGSEGKKISKV